jgi:hypothetical protein
MRRISERRSRPSVRLEGPPWRAVGPFSHAVVITRNELCNQPSRGLPHNGLAYVHSIHT